jgi:hypothetical protein
MPDFKFGVQGVNDSFTSVSNYSVLNNSNGGSAITVARVKKIILDNSDVEVFKQFGEWNSIGTIFWSPIGKKLDKDGTTEYNPSTYASPLFPNIKHYPLVNELVYIIQLPVNDITTGQPVNNGWYYFPPLNIWNSQLHNALPEEKTSTNQNQIDDYSSTFAGQVRRPEDNSTEIDLGSTFVEANSINIHPLLPYEGDIIYEGRFGNSIRLGSTVKNAVIPNEWSSVGENGDPITIIRNGQSNYSDDSWIPKTEDINKDASDIWLTSKQKLPIRPSSNLTDSYAKSKAPEDPREYSKNQIVLNSGRLTFNAKNDAIILGANSTIHLTANESVNADASKYIALTAPKVYLGSSQGVEGTNIQSAVLGEELNSLLGEIAQYLTTLNTAFSSATDSLGVPIVSLLSTAAPTSLALSQRLQAVVSGKNLLSNKVKVSK